MAGSNINRVILTGNLVADPEKRNEKSPVNLRIAVNGRRQVDGQWVDVANYFRIVVWGAQGENCMRYLSKGRPIAVDGELRWHQYEDKTGQKREGVDIIAQTVQFLGGRDDASSGGGNSYSSGVNAASSDVPIDTNDFVSAPAGGGAADDDIPF